MKGKSIKIVELELHAPSNPSKNTMLYLHESLAINAKIERERCKSALGGIGTNNPSIMKLVVYLGATIKCFLIEWSRKLTRGKLRRRRCRRQRWARRWSRCWCSRTGPVSAKWRSGNFGTGSCRKLGQFRRATPTKRLCRSARRRRHWWRRCARWRSRSRSRSRRSRAWACRPRRPSKWSSRLLWRKTTL